MNFHKKISFIFFLFLIGGCATFQPKSGENGEKLVYVNELRMVGTLGNNGPTGAGAIGGQIGGSVAGTSGSIKGGVIEGALTSVVSALRGPRVLLSYMDFDPTAPGAPRFFPGHAKTIEKAPWEGVFGLRKGTWAVLTQDAKGDSIVVPCSTPCQPKDEVVATSVEQVERHESTAPQMVK